MTEELSDVSALLQLFTGSPWQEFKVATGDFAFHVRRGEPRPRTTVYSPHLATFRHAAGIGSAVKAGEAVAALEILGEATPLVAEQDGELVEFLAGDGAFVEFGAPLFTLIAR